MSLLVVIGVAVVVFLWVRTTRRARQAWLQQLALPGKWRADEDADSAYMRELTLSGDLDAGEYVLQTEDGQLRGRWRLVGHTLTLSGDPTAQSYDLHLFKAGNIGLEDAEGGRYLLYKAVDNVVPLRDKSGAS